MTLKFDISAGEFFELIRPTVLLLSALASIWLLASARRHRVSTFVALGLAVGTLFFPLITLPLYLARRFIRYRSQRPSRRGETPKTPSSLAGPRGRISIPLTYAAVVLCLVGFYLYRDHQSVDGHLARATQAKVSGKRGRAIDEYRAALTIDDDPHTRKLLAMELADTGDWTGALFELRTAEQAGETDDLLPFKVATLLDSLNLPNQATLEYQRFLQGKACTQALPDDRCAGASARVQAARAESRAR